MHNVEDVTVLNPRKTKGAKTPATRKILYLNFNPVREFQPVDGSWIWLTDELNNCLVAGDIDHDPKRLSHIDARKKDALILTVDIEHHITAGCVVERQQDANVDRVFR